MYVVNFLHFSGLFSNSIMQGQVKLRGSRKSPSWGWSLHLVSLATTWFFVHYCAKEYRRESGTPFSTWYAQLIAFWSFTYSLTIATTKANIENIVRHVMDSLNIDYQFCFFLIIEHNSNFKISFYSTRSIQRKFRLHNRVPTANQKQYQYLKRLKYL